MTRRVVTFGALVILAAVGSGLLLAQSPQLVASWTIVGAADNAFGDGPSVALADGRTLIVAGTTDAGAATDIVSIFDPDTRSFESAGVLLSARTGHTATLRKDGRVLITGGMNGSLLSVDVELFDPVAGTSELVATLPEPRTGHSAARLNDGRVIIVGGRTIDGTVLRTALMYDPETNVIAPVQGELNTARAFASAATLLDGRVVVIGGTDGTTDLASAEIFYPLSESFSTVATQLTAPLQGHAAVMLPHNGSVLVAGGTSNGVAQQGVELFLPAEFPDPFSYGEGRFSPTGSISVARSNVIAGPTPTEGYAFVTGGGSTDVERYRFATIKTDKDDYAPGEHAIITGTGWQPGETVTLLFQEDPAVHDDYVLTVTADGQGNIFTDEWAPERHDLNVRFYLTASDSISKAQTTFTDGLKVTVSRDNPNPRGLTVASGSTTTVTFRIDNDNNSGDQSATLGVNYSLVVTGGLSATGAPLTGSVSLAGNSAFASRTWNIVAPVGPATGTVALTATVVTPACSGANCSDTVDYDFTVLPPPDTTPPVITPVVTGTLGNNGWYTSNVNISWNVTDPESAITSPACTASSVTTDTPGQTFSCSATSTGGTSSNSVTIERDASAPNAPSGGKSPAANASGWNNTDVSVSFTDAGDNGPSGIAFCTSAASLTAETAGTNVSGTCTDSAGNVSPATTVTVKIDKTAPSDVVGAAARPADHNGWFTAPVNITFSGTDPLSGIASCTTVSFSGPEGTSVQVFGSCTDVAGNASPYAVFLLNYDTTAPSISGSRTPEANGFGWNNTDVSVSFDCTDATSGVAAGNPTGNAVVSTEGAGQSVPGTCVDNAGHSASATVSDINIDKTAPTIDATRTPEPNANGWNNTEVTANYTASDALSGLDSATTGSHVFNTDGPDQSHTFTVTDKAGNSASATVSGVNIDRVAPEISAIRSPEANANGWNNTDVTVTFTCTDTASGLATGYPQAPTTLTAEGANHSVDGSCVDQAGNTANTSVTGINIDKTAPTISASRTPDPNASGWNSTNVTASYNASDALSGLDAVSPATGNHVFNTDGADQSHTFTVTDKAGNSNTATISGVNVDKTAPTISAIRAPVANANGWNNTDVTASYNANDVLSGLDAVSTATGSHLFSAEGAGQSFTFTVTDLAGNSASATIANVNIDKTAPTISGSRTPAPNANGWNNTNVTASYLANDGLSGLDSPTTGDHVFNTDGGGQSHTFTVVDKAGNSASTTISGVNVDKTAPSISGGRLPLANANGWNNSNVNASYTASDATSGLDSSSPASGGHSFTAEGSGQSITFTVTDLAGNSASFTVSNVNIDKTAPSISASRTPGPNSYGWNNTDVIASYSASDLLSGLESPATGSHTFSNEGDGQSYTFIVVDLAGNSASATVNGVNIDKTAPVVAVTGVSNNAVYTLGAVPPAGCTTTDPLSGVLVSAAVSTSGAVPPGVGTITASCAGATDKAGNAASTSSVTFTVQFAAEGLMCNGAPGHQMLQPINFTGSSVFPKKGGSTVPAKFRVCGADGVSIGPTAVVKNFVLYGVLNGTTIDVNEAPVESTNHDTAFRWSAADAQWIFNIGTKDLAAGKTYVFRVYLHDGTHIQFQFGLK